MLMQPRPSAEVVGPPVPSVRCFIRRLLRLAVVIATSAAARPPGRKDRLAPALYSAGMNHLEVRELRYFVAVAEELNFSRAAERLDMAQPPLSKAIRQLEAKLGVRLLERTTRRVALTAAGQVLLEQGRADVALLRGPFDAHGLDLEELDTEPRLVALPAGHRLAGRRRLLLADLAGEPVPHAAEADEQAAEYWAGRDPASLIGTARPGLPPAGPRVRDLGQLREVVALGQAGAFLPGPPPPP